LKEFCNNSKDKIKNYKKDFKLKIEEYAEAVEKMQNAYDVAALYSKIDEIKYYMDSCVNDIEYSNGPNEIKRRMIEFLHAY
jgi:uncharacterized coiled-coil DUF342 family protein